MTRRESVELTQRVLQVLSTEFGLEVADSVHRAPREDFVGQSRFEADRELFWRVPHVIGWAGELAQPGQFITRDVMGVPVLAVRGKDGDLHAFLNGCAHRGAQVAVGCGTAARFVCPYHGWMYRLDGSLAGVPSRRMFADAGLQDRKLRQLPVSERGGLISVGLREDVDMSGHLEELEEWLDDNHFTNRTHVEMRRFDLATNWKLAVSINFEGYHFPFLHRDTLSPLVTDNSVFDLFGRHARWAFPYREIDKHADMPEQDWPDQFYGTVVYFLFPSVVLIEAAGTTQLLRIYPAEQPGQCTVFIEYGSTTPILSDQDREWHTFGFDSACTVLQEDFPAAEACQRGLASGVDHVVFGRNEPVLQHLARTWAHAAYA